MWCGMYYKRYADTSLSRLNNSECIREFVYFLFLTLPSFCALHRKRIKYITVIFTEKNCIHSVYNSSDVVWCECFAYNSLSLRTRSSRLANLQCCKNLHTVQFFGAAESILCLLRVKLFIRPAGVITRTICWLCHSQRFLYQDKGQYYCT